MELLLLLKLQRSGLNFIEYHIETKAQLPVFKRKAISTDYFVCSIAPRSTFILIIHLNASKMFKLRMALKSFCRQEMRNY